MSDRKYAPWYVIARRLVFFPIYHVGLAICTFAIACGDSPSSSIIFWKNNV